MSSFPDQPVENPYAATSTLETSASPGPGEAVGSYGGIGRMAYFGYTFLAGVLFNVVTMGVGAAGQRNAEIASALMLVGLVAYFVVLFVIVAKRMTNLGYNPWWCLGMIVPFLNILVGFRCIALPEGYADHRTLDTVAKIWCGLFLAMLLLIVLAVVFANVKA